MAREMRTVDLSSFDPSGLDRGRSKWVEILWWITRVLIVQSGVPWPSRVRRSLLVMFGARVGRGVYLRPGLRVHFPWKLTVGDNVWIGENTTILNLENVTIESNAALAHEVYIAAAGHDIRSPTFEYRNEPVIIRSGSWIATRAYIGPGVEIGTGAVVAACACVVADVEPHAIVGGVPARRLATRTIR